MMRRSAKVSALFNPAQVKPRGLSGICFGDSGILQSSRFAGRESDGDISCRNAVEAKANRSGKGGQSCNRCIERSSQEWRAAFLTLGNRR